jgi:hypothetical protein
MFLAWQDQAPSHQWFPVGRVDAYAEKALYCFRYTNGALRAKREAGFPLLLEFPSLEREYWSADLFPLFRNRVMNRARPDLAEYLHSLDLAEDTDPFEILAVSGGRRATDSYEVFPKIEKRKDGSFTCRFFLHGWRHVNLEAQRRIDRLRPSEGLYVTLELTNPVTGLAVQIQTEDYHMIGWAPRYLVGDLAAAMAESAEYKAHVVRVNPQPAPSKQRVLIEMGGTWVSHQPMSHEDFIPIVENAVGG